MSSLTDTLKKVGKAAAAAPKSKQVAAAKAKAPAKKASTSSSASTASALPPGAVDVTDQIAAMLGGAIPGAPATVGTPGTVPNLDIASLLAQGSAYANQPAPTLPDYGSALSSYQAQVAQLLAGQLAGIDAQVGAANKGLADRTRLFEQGRQTGIASNNTNRDATMAALQQLLAPSGAAQAGQDAQQAAGRAGYGFSPIAGTTDGQANIANAGAANILMGYSNTDAQMQGDIAALGALISTQGGNDLGLMGAQQKAAATNKANAGVADYTAQLEQMRLKALTDYAMGTPERQLQFTNMLGSLAGQNQDAASKNISNQMQTSQFNAGEQNAFARLASELKADAVKTGLAQSNSDRTFNYNAAQDKITNDLNQQKIEASIAAKGATGATGIKNSKEEAVALGVASQIDQTLLGQVGNLTGVLAAKDGLAAYTAYTKAGLDPLTFARAMAVKNYGTGADYVDATTALRQFTRLASEIAAVEARKDKKVNVTVRAAELEKGMRAEFDRFTLGRYLQGRQFVDSYLQSQVDAYSKAAKSAPKPAVVKPSEPVTSPSASLIDG